MGKLDPYRFFNPEDKENNNNNNNNNSNSSSSNSSSNSNGGEGGKAVVGRLKIQVNKFWQLNKKLIKEMVIVIKFGIFFEQCRVNGRNISYSARSGHLCVLCFPKREAGESTLGSSPIFIDENREREYLRGLLLLWVRRRGIWDPIVTLQMKGRWESNMNVLFGISISLKPNKKLTTRINCFHLWSIIFQIGNFYVGHLCELSAQPQEKRVGQGTAANLCLTPVPCLTLRSWGWAKSSFMQ